MIKQIVKMPNNVSVTFPTKCLSNQFGSQLKLFIYSSFLSADL